jgi:hypothetical protein
MLSDLQDRAWLKSLQENQCGSDTPEPDLQPTGLDLGRAFAALARLHLLDDLDDDPELGRDGLLHRLRDVRDALAGGTGCLENELAWFVELPDSLLEELVDAAVDAAG